MGAPCLMGQARDVLHIHHYSLRNLLPKNNITVGFALPLRQ
jgi:hypothetical protein